MNPLAAPAQQMHVLAPVLLAHHPKPLSANASHLAHGLAHAGGQMFKGMSGLSVVAVLAVLYLIFWALSSAISRKFGNS